MRVYIHPGCAEPEALVEALMARAPFVKNVEILHLMTTGRADYIAPQVEGHFRHNAMFIGGNVRQAVNEGRADYTPVFLSQVEELFESGQMPIDVALIQVSPPDAHGFCSFGVGVDATLTAARLRQVCDCAGERPDAANLWRLLPPREGYRRGGGSLPAVVRIETHSDHGSPSRHWQDMWPA